MPEMIKQVVVTVKPSPELLGRINRALKKQSKTSRNLKLFALAGVGYVAWSESKRRKQEAKIDQLTAKVTELERSKGE